MNKNIVYRFCLLFLLTIAICFNTSQLQAKDTKPINLIKNIYSSMKKKGRSSAAKQKPVKSQQKAVSTDSELKKEEKKEEYLKISVEQNLDNTIIYFPWKENVKASIFQRNNNLWVVFDKKKEIKFTIYNSVKEVSSVEHAIVSDISQITTPLENTATILAIKLENLDNTENYFRVYKNNKEWSIEISNQYLGLKDLEKIAIHSHPFEIPSPRIELLTNEADLNIISFFDPYVGDKISAVPISNIQKLVPYNHGFVDLNIFKSIQGAAIQHKSDGLKITSDNYFIVINNKDGLNISSKFGAISTLSLFQKPAFVKYKNFESKQALLGLMPYVLHIRKFQKIENIWKNKVIKSLPNQEYNTRINLAMLYLANGFYKEAKDQMRLAVLYDNPLLRDNYAVLLLSAAIEFMLEDYANAYRFIDKIELPLVPISNLEEVKLWKAIISMKFKNDSNSHYDDISQYFEQNAKFIQFYPPAFLKQLKFASLEYMIDKGHFDTAERIIDSLSFYDFTKEEAARFYHNVGNFYLKIGDTKQSLSFFTKCASNDNLIYYHSLCTYNKINLELAHNKISKTDAANQLQYLDLFIRNTPFEAQILKKIANLYYETKEYVKALKTWSIIEIYYPNVLETLNITNTMTQLFIDIFLTDLGNKYNSFKKVAIFDEFHKLNPIGELGDKIALNLVDNLINLDLLNRAVKLLEHQVQYRLFGMEKEEAINKLATLLLELNEDKKALDTINKGINSNLLPKDIAENRKYLNAQIFFKMHEDGKAIKLLKGDLSKKADDIRLEIYWNEKNWRNFNDNSEPYIYSIMNKHDKLNEEDTKKILKQSISYAYLGDYNLLNKLYANFKNRFEKNGNYTKVIELLNSLSYQNNKKNLKMTNTQDLQNVLNQMYYLLK